MGLMGLRDLTDLFLRGSLFSGLVVGDLTDLFLRGSLFSGLVVGDFTYCGLLSASSSTALRRLCRNKAGWKYTHVNRIKTVNEE